MSDGWSRFAPLTGVIFVALTVVSILISSSTPGVHSSGTQVLAFYSAHHGAQMASDFLFGLGAIFLLFFAGSFRSYLRRVEGAEGLAALAFGGAVLFAGGIAIFSSLDLALADARNTLDPSGAVALNALGNDFFFPFVVGAVVFMIGSGVAIVRTGALPRWLGWVAIVFGIVNATPLGLAAIFGILVWLLVVSILVFMRGDRPVGAPATAAPGTAGSGGL